MPNPDELFTGTWKNQRDSILTLSVTNGVVTGTFDSGVGDDNQPIVVQVEGRTMGDQITFNVAYRKFSTVVAWVGQLTQQQGKEDLLETVWLHSSDITDNEEPQWLWSAVRTGADHFRRQG